MEAQSERIPELLSKESLVKVLTSLLQSCHLERVQNRHRMETHPDIQALLGFHWERSQEYLVYLVQCSVRHQKEENLVRR
jgi:hypothetical protein